MIVRAKYVIFASCCDWAIVIFCYVLHQFAAFFDRTLVNFSASLDLSWMIGALHVVGHDLACQLNFHPFHIHELKGKLIGRLDGEGQERAWAVLRKWDRTMKNMTLANFYDWAWHVMKGWNERKRWALPDILARRASYYVAQTKVATSELAALASSGLVPPALQQQLAQQFLDQQGLIRGGVLQAALEAVRKYVVAAGVLAGGADAVAMHAIATEHPYLPLAAVHGLHGLLLLQAVYTAATACEHTLRCYYLHVEHQKNNRCMDLYWVPGVWCVVRFA